MFFILTGPVQAGKSSFIRTMTGLSDKEIQIGTGTSRSCTNFTMMNKVKKENMIPYKGKYKIEPILIDTPGWNDPEGNKKRSNKDTMREIAELIYIFQQHKSEHHRQLRVNFLIFDSLKGDKNEMQLSFQQLTEMYQDKGEQAKRASILLFTKQDKMDPYSEEAKEMENLRTHSPLIYDKFTQQE